jgi:hypothetical protein
LYTYYLGWVQGSIRNNSVARESSRSSWSCAGGTQATSNSTTALTLTLGCCDAATLNLYTVYSKVNHTKNESNAVARVTIAQATK